mgnify:CR=1 FL=1
MLASQRASPNSPQWFNTGLNWAYGIEGPAQGHYFVNPETKELERSVNAYEHPQPHACFIQSVSDDLVNEGGIMDLWTREARLFKFGSGTGSNFSRIRGEGEPLSGGGMSSGLMSFLRIGDRAAGAIKSGGTTRRAAKMVCLDMDHPDIEAFVNWKMTEEEKVAALVAGSQHLQNHGNEILAAIQAYDDDGDRFNQSKNKPLAIAINAAMKAYVPENLIARVLELGEQGYSHIEIDTYDTSWEGEAYSTVSGQNSNNSVRVSNDFMHSVIDDKDWNLYWRTELDVAKKEGAVAMFGEKYGDEVRVISVADYSMELCGGTHVDRTGDIGFFKIIEESSLASGVRRVVAVTGPESVSFAQRQSVALNNIKSKLNCSLDSISDRIDQLISEKKSLEKDLKNKRKLSSSFNIDSAIKKGHAYNDITIVTELTDASSIDDLKDFGNALAQKLDKGVGVLGATLEKPSLVVVISDRLVKKGLHAGVVAKELGSLMGGGGGGRPNMATAGGKDDESLISALKKAVNIVKKNINVDRGNLDKEDFYKCRDISRTAWQLQWIYQGKWRACAPLQSLSSELR